MTSCITSIFLYQRGVTWQTLMHIIIISFESYLSIFTFISSVWMMFYGCCANGHHHHATMWTNAKFLTWLLNDRRQKAIALRRQLVEVEFFVKYYIENAAAGKYYPVSHRFSNVGLLSRIECSFESVCIRVRRALILLDYSKISMWITDNLNIPWKLQKSNKLVPVLWWFLLESNTRWIIKLSIGPKVSRAWMLWFFRTTTVKSLRKDALAIELIKCSILFTKLYLILVDTWVPCQGSFIEVLHKYIKGMIFFDAILNNNILTSNKWFFYIIEHLN